MKNLEIHENWFNYFFPQKNLDDDLVTKDEILFIVDLHTQLSSYGFDCSCELLSSHQSNKSQEK